MIRKWTPVIALGVSSLLAASLGSACASTGDGDFAQTGSRAPDASQEDPSATPGGQEDQPCVPDWCPPDMGGTPCCISESGPCGVDFGTGCVDPATVSRDAG